MTFVYVISIKSNFKYRLMDHEKLDSSKIGRLSHTDNIYNRNSTY